jgi:hypothetical protein
VYPLIVIRCERRGIASDVQKLPVAAAAQAVVQVVDSFAQIAGSLRQTQSLRHQLSGPVTRTPLIGGNDNRPGPAAQVFQCAIQQMLGDIQSSLDADLLGQALFAVA